MLELSRYPPKSKYGKISQLQTKQSKQTNKQTSQIPFTDKHNDERETLYFKHVIIGLRRSRSRNSVLDKTITNLLVSVEATAAF